MFTPDRAPNCWARRRRLSGSRPIPWRRWIGAAPVFLLHAIDDASVPVENSLQLLTTLKAAAVPSEAHLFQEGGHGFGIRLIQGKPAQVWPDLVRAWAAQLDFPL